MVAERVWGSDFSPWWHYLAVISSSDRSCNSQLRAKNLVAVLGDWGMREKRGKGEKFPLPITNYLLPKDK
ncbi:hypothetical protein FDUTEX481_02503 [Tolypothrix sp. PCC 7601]|nr:hypothetical protein FDUTEX481_02503 [Tolypothrix sp. PCC 7601]